MAVNYFMVSKNGADLAAPGFPVTRGYPLGVADAGRKNLIPNSNFEENASGWAVGIGTLSRDTSDYLFGSASLHVTDTLTTSANSVNPYPTAPIPVTAGLPYAISYYVKPDEGPRTFRISGRWRDSGGSPVGSVLNLGATSCPSGQWTRVSAIPTAPAGAVSLEFGPSNPIAIATDEAGGDADHYWFDGFMVEQSATLGSYIEGTVPTLNVEGVPADLAPLLFVRSLETPHDIRPTGFSGSVFRAVRDPDVEGDDSGDPLATQIYNHGWVLAPFLQMWMWDEGLLSWPPPSNVTVVPVKGTPAVQCSSGLVGNFLKAGGYFGFEAFTASSNVGTVRQVLSGGEGSTRQVATILDRIKATNTTQRAAINSAYASGLGEAFWTAVNTLYDVATPQFMARWIFALGFVRFRHDLVVPVGWGSAALEWGLGAVIAKEHGLVGGVFSTTYYNALTAGLRAGITMPAGY